MADNSQQPIIQLEDVDKFFGTFQALRNVNLRVNKGERIVVCGPSGSGKSTMIRCINRLEEHDGGRITINGHELTSDVKDIDAVRREVGMVFQSFIALGNTIRRPNRLPWLPTRSGIVRSAEASSSMPLGRSGYRGCLPPRLEDAGCSVSQPAPTRCSLLTIRPFTSMR